MVAESLNNIEFVIHVVKQGYFQVCVLTACDYQRLSLQPQINSASCQYFTAVKAFFEGVFGLLFMNLKRRNILSLAHLRKPIIMDDHLISECIRQNKDFSIYSLINVLVHKSKLHWPIATFGIDREHLQALGMIPNICIITIEAQ